MKNILKSFNCKNKKKSRNKWPVNLLLFTVLCGMGFVSVATRNDHIQHEQTPPLDPQQNIELSSIPSGQYNQVDPIIVCGALNR